jgi:hypothetical protein
MSIARLAIALAFMFLGCVAGAAENCSKRELRRPNTAVLELDGVQRRVREQPAFYLRGADQRFTYFFEPDHVLAVVEAKKAAHPGLQNSLERMRLDLPLREDTDLFKFALRDPTFAWLLDYFVAELFDAGHGSIEFLPLDQPVNLTVIRRVSWSDRETAGRKYCRQDGLELLEIVDVIID